MPINQLNFPILQPDQTSVGAGLNAAGDLQKQLFTPLLSRAQAFNQAVSPAAALAGNTTQMLFNKDYRKLVNAMAKAGINILGTGGSDAGLASILPDVLGGGDSDKSSQSQTNNANNQPSSFTNYLMQKLHGIESFFKPGSSQQENTDSDSSSPPTVFDSNNSMTDGKQKLEDPTQLFKDYTSKNGITDVNNVDGTWFIGTQNGKRKWFKIPGVSG